MPSDPRHRRLSFPASTGGGQADNSTVVPALAAFLRRPDSAAAIFLTSIGTVLTGIIRGILRPSASARSTELAGTEYGRRLGRALLPAEARRQGQRFELSVMELCRGARVPGRRQGLPNRDVLCQRSLEHDPEKACPALDAGWVPVFRKRIMLKQKDRGGMTIRRKVIPL